MLGVVAIEDATLLPAAGVELGDATSPVTGVIT
jgi:hypothetical protein